MNGTTTTGKYEYYAAWKGWDAAEFLTCSHYRRLYFKGELKGIDIAGKRVLELGFGNGSFLRFAKDAGAEVAGTELLADAARAAQQHGIKVYQPDLSNVAADSAGQFDLVAAFDVLEHIAWNDLELLFEKLAALIKPDGYFIARFPNGQSPLGCVFQYGDHTHRAVLSPALLMQLLHGKPWQLVRADNPFVVTDGGALRRVGLVLRSGARALLQVAINRLFGLDVTLDPNVTVVLRRG